MKASLRRVGTDERHQQSIEQGNIAVGCNCQMLIGNFAGSSPPRVDDDDFGAALFACCREALIKHRVAPGEVRANQHNEVGLFDVFVVAGHGISAERSLMAGDRGRHAQPRIAVDIGSADVSLHQLVGGVIVLGQQLPGNVESDTFWTVRGDSLAEAAGDQIEGIVPLRDLTINQRFQQPAFERQGFTERAALRA